MAQQQACNFLQYDLWMKITKYVIKFINLIIPYIDYATLCLVVHAQSHDDMI